MSPLIVGAEEGRISERPPPVTRLMPHKWLRPASREGYDERRAQGYELYVSKVAEEKMRNHALGRISDRLEVMGLMLGSIHRHEGTTYALVRDVATTDLEASSVYVRFSRGGWEQLFSSLDDCGFNYVIVGWYHSHPGHGCFMSPTDVDTQRGIFNQPYHSAIVVDPINREIEAFGLREALPVPRPFAVYWDEFQDPYYGVSVRRRELAED
jgi:proteasome lid subunit RPN8/RPN11